MKSNEIIEGNVILEEFMDGMLYHNLTAQYLNNPSSLYHLDWNWLMPVVERIESLGYAVLICYTRVVVECCVMSDKTVIYKNDDNSITKIENVFLACVEFAKWYKSRLK